VPGAEANIWVALFGVGLQGLKRNVPPKLAAFWTGRRPWQQPRLAAPGDQLLQGGGVQQVPQVVGGDIGVGQGPVSG
jgi:hypothetical protein